jgi:hypothetical protein
MKELLHAKSMMKILLNVCSKGRNDDNDPYYYGL